MAEVTLTVNGVRRAVGADPGTPLLWVLRDELGLTGTKYGCGEGLCGSCTVLEEGAPVRSCQVPLAQAAGKRYTTIEGLSHDGSHPAQQAWLEQNVSQCGFCQPGMILEAAALLARGADPSEEEIARALGDHLCRCGSYPRILSAVRLAARRAAAGGRP